MSFFTPTTGARASGIRPPAGTTITTASGIRPPVGNITTTPRGGGGGGRSTTAGPFQSSSVTASDLTGLCHQIFEEVRRLREETKKQSDEIKKLSQSSVKLHESFKEYAEGSFQIETSIHKDGLIKEAGALFAKSLTRQPSQEDIAQSVMKVLGNDGRNKTKFNKGKTFCSGRLTDLRCEERRRIFGNKPCEAFPQYTTEKFVDKMQSIIKANINSGLYMKHVALLRKFAREVPDAKKELYKRFREWVNQYFAEGAINNEVW